MSVLSPRQSSTFRRPQCRRSIAVDIMAAVVNIEAAFAQKTYERNCEQRQITATQLWALPPDQKPATTINLPRRRVQWIHPIPKAMARGPASRATSYRRSRQMNRIRARLSTPMICLLFSVPSQSTLVMPRQTRNTSPFAAGDTCPADSLVPGAYFVSEAVPSECWRELN